MNYELQITYSTSKEDGSADNITDRCQNAIERLKAIRQKRYDTNKNNEDAQKSTDEIVADATKKLRERTQSLREQSKIIRMANGDVSETNKSMETGR